MYKYAILIPIKHAILLHNYHFFFFRVGWDGGPGDFPTLRRQKAEHGHVPEAGGTPCGGGIPAGLRRRGQL